MPVGFGASCETASPGTYQVAVEYQQEEAGCYATRAARRLCQNIIETGTYPEPELRIDLEDLRALRAGAAQGASTEALIQEAENRGIPWKYLETCGLFQFGYGKHQKRVQAALTSHSNVLGVELACDKERTKEILTSMGAPVPLGKVIYAFRDLEDAINDLGGYPIVIKPLDGNQGRGITIDIRSWRQAEFAYGRAKDISDGVIVEHFYRGRDHRILVVNHKVIAVAERVPAHVVGNGKDTISTLVDRENKDVRRGEGHDTSLTKIKLDAATDEMLSRQGFTLNSILQPDQICYLRANANLSTGGTAIDRTEEIHPDTIWLAERASRIIDLDIVGIDVITTDITKPLKEVDGVIVEVNAAPGLRMHMAPSRGLARNVAAPILDMLFPAEAPTQIPVVAVAAAAGRTASPTPLIAHIFNQAYDAVGYTSTKGVYISNYRVKQGDATNAESAELILEDPTVDMAVLETSRSSILRSGLAFPHCDVGVVLEASDQIGSTCTLDHRAKVFSVIPGAVHADGYAVLNADDPRVVAMAERVQGKIAYFSMDPENSVVRSHLQQGGIAAVYDHGYLAIVQQNDAQRIENIANLPLSVRGFAPAALAACLAAYVQGVTIEQIRAALLIYPASEQQPPESTGRFNFNDYDLPSLIQPFLDSQNTAPRAERFREIPPLNGFCFWGTLSAAAPDLEVRDTEGTGCSSPAESEPPAVTAVERAKPQNYLEADFRSVGPNDPTTLWIEFENRLKPQNVLQERISKATTVASMAAAPEDADTERDQSNSGVRTKIATLQSKVAAIEKTLESTRKEIAAFSEAMAHHEVKAWAVDQRDQIRRWAKQQAPAAKRVAQVVGEQAVDKGGTVVAIAFVLFRSAAQLAFELGKDVGAICWEKWGSSTPSANAETLNSDLQEIINVPNPQPEPNSSIKTHDLRDSRSLSSTIGLTTPPSVLPLPADAVGELYADAASSAQALSNASSNSKFS